MCFNYYQCILCDNFYQLKTKTEFKTLLQTDRDINDLLESIVEQKNSAHVISNESQTSFIHSRTSFTKLTSCMTAQILIFCFARNIENL